MDMKKRKPKTYWTSDELAYAVELLHENMPRREIVARLNKRFGRGRDTDSLSEILVKTGYIPHRTLKPPKPKASHAPAWSKREEQVLRDYYVQGYGDEYIAEILSRDFDHKRGFWAIKRRRLKMGLFRK